MYYIANKEYISLQIIYWDRLKAGRLRKRRLPDIALEEGEAEWETISPHSAAF